MRQEHQASVGARIASLREQQGWSQRALARWMGLDQSAVSRIEAGRRRVSAEELHRFADALHVSADALLRGDPSPLRDAALPGAKSGRAKEIPAMSSAGAADALLPAPVDLEIRASFREDAMVPTHELNAVAEQATVFPYADSEDPTRRRAEQSSARYGAPRLAGLPGQVAAVARDWFELRALADAREPEQRWSTGHSAEGKPERLARASASVHLGAAAGDVLYDRVARFWRSELHVEPDDGPLPDIVPLFEDGYGAQVIVARAGESTSGGPAADRPVAAAFAVSGVPFIFVNAARPVVLQRFALVHAFAHLALGHGDVVDRRIEWSRNVPPEAAANDFAEEFLAPVRAVQRWFERRETTRWPGLEDLLDLANAFGISAWAALYRSRAAGRLQAKQFHPLRAELQRREWELLPRQAYLGGLCDTLTHLTPDQALPAGAYGPPAVLRVPAPMRAWALTALQGGRLSLEDAAAALRLEPGALAEQLARLGLD